MSGDVQPRKRKDKKRKKDDLGLEDSRGTAAVFGDGDVFIHSQHDHSTGGHWCAKVVFFSLLAVLLTLIGLIILENRGLTDLEASTIESRYSGVLEGWIEDAPDDDHHDEHTLELNHPDAEDESMEHDTAIDHDDLEDDHDDEDDDEEEQNSEENEQLRDEDEDENDEDDNREDDDEEEEDAVEEDEEEDADEEDEVDENNSIEEGEYYTKDADDDNEHEDIEDNDVDSIENDIDNHIKHMEDDDDDNIDDDNEIDEDDDDHNTAEQDDDFSDEILNEQNEEEDDHNEGEDEHEESVEVEHIENEPSDEDPISTELPALPEEEDEQQSEEIRGDDDMASLEDDDDDDDDKADEDDFLEHDFDDDIEPLIVEHVTAPSGKPYNEVDDSSEVLPADTLADEEEYEKRQEELRREEEKASHLWLKVGVGAALLLATHAVLRRASHSGTDSHAHDASEETISEPESATDRRMTLIPEAPTKIVPKSSTYETSKKGTLEEVAKKSPILIQTTRPTQDDDEEEIDEDLEVETEPLPIIKSYPTPKKEITPDKELYSDEDEIIEDEDVVVKVQSQALASQQEKKRGEVDDESEDIPDDVEIIDEEQIEEELEEEEEDEEISDVDDAELLSRLEAKYGRLPEPERYERKPKDGGNSVEDFWPDEPNDPFWRQQLDEAEQNLHQGEWESALALTSAAEVAGAGRARWLRAAALDAGAESRRDNRLLARAVTAYRQVIDMHDRLSDRLLLRATDRALERLAFKGDYLGTEPILRLLIRRFPDEVGYRNNLTISFLMANRADLAAKVLEETLRLWPDDRVALAHYGFVLKTHYNRLEESVDMFRRALDGDGGPAIQPRFYYHLGDALLLLGRFDEAHEVHKRGASLGFFLSPSQRSLYNVDRLKGRPWWNIDETPYEKLARALEKSWKEILQEGEAAKFLYEQEKEGLRERGQWSQLDLFARGREIPGRCKTAPVTCSIVRSEPAAVGCRRGQIKFSAMGPGTHVRPHVGPTNCRLRMHLGLSNVNNTYLRVDKETRQWEVGKVLMFDDSFEHEVWHNGSDTRLVLIVDVWHPELTMAERSQLPAI